MIKVIQGTYIILNTEGLGIVRKSIVDAFRSMRNNSQSDF